MEDLKKVTIYFKTGIKISFDISEREYKEFMEVGIKRDQWIIDDPNKTYVIPYSSIDFVEISK